MEVTVDRTELLGIIRQNREAHRATFEKAVKVFTDKLIAWHKEQAKILLRGGEAAHWHSLPVPEDHTEDYDTIISMLEMHVEPTLVLSFREYDNFVRDNWGWSKTFAANTQSYVS